MSGENSSSTIHQVDDAASPQTVPAYALFDSTSACLATFFGTPIAGAGLMALTTAAWEREAALSRPSLLGSR